MSLDNIATKTTSFPENNLSIIDDKKWDGTLETLEITNIHINQETILKNIENIFSDNILDKKIDLFATNQQKREVIEINYKLCPDCEIPGKILDTSIICENCGMEREWNIHHIDGYNASIEQNYNTSDNSFITFNVVGNNSYCYNKSLLKTCSNYVIYRNNTNKKEILNRIYQYEGNIPPKNVINSAIDLFEQIKNKGYVYRGDGKLGVIGACLYYACMINNLTRTPKEISSIMNIEEKFLSKGDKILQELNELGVISIPINHEPLDDYILKYFHLLGIDMKYKDFVVHIINRAEKKHLHIKNESRTTTKCVGVIYLLTCRLPELKHIKKETISKECSISKTTFIKYHNLIMENFPLMKKSFKKYRIPIPIEYKIE